MKILVIDDNQGNLEAAKKQLANHELILCSSFEEARELLASSNDYDVVMTDLFLPKCLDGMRSEIADQFAEEQPYGLVFALTAVKKGIKRIAVVSNATHHTHPINWALDLVGSGSIWGENAMPEILPGGVKFLYSNCLIFEDEKAWDNSWNEISQRGHSKGSPKAVKNWGRTLDVLLK